MKPKLCSIEGCQKPNYCKTYCRPHYSKLLYHGNPLYKKIKDPICKIENCQKPKKKNQTMCCMHVARKNRNGDPLVITRSSTIYNFQGHPYYQTYRGMTGRCNQKSSHGYKNYGGRGIKVCYGWKKPNGALSFFKDMGEKPHPNYTLDRIDNDGHYSCGHCEECIANGWPMNCRWADRTTQNLNRRPRQNKTGFTGVTKNNSKIPGYSAEIVFKGIKTKLGTYPTAETAHKAYLEAKEKRDFLINCNELFENINELNKI